MARAMKRNGIRGRAAALLSEKLSQEGQHGCVRVSGDADWPRAHAIVEHDEVSAGRQLAKVEPIAGEGCSRTAGHLQKARSGHSLTHNAFRGRFDDAVVGCRTAGRQDNAVSLQLRIGRIANLIVANFID